MHRARKLNPPRGVGFTLLEVLMVVVIMAFLARIAIPTFRKTIEMSYWRMARDVLYSIYTAERSYYYANNYQYKNPGGSWDTLYMDNPNVTGGVTFTVAVTAGPPATFQVTAIRSGGGGPPLGCLGRFFRIDQTRTFIPGSWGAPPPVGTGCICC